MSTQFPHPDQSRGLAAGVVAYLMWGFVPFYWKQLAAVPAWELILHRVSWSLVLCALLLTWTRGWAGFAGAFATPRLIAINLAGAMLLSMNWMLYVWGVNAGRVVECSLGYYLTPLLSVVLGGWLLGEPLSRRQGIAVVLAGAGVGWLMLASGAAPWIALGIAFSWSLYGLCRKRSPLGAVQSLAVETALLAPVSAGLLGWLAWTGRGALGHVPAFEQVLVLLAGVVTSIPLIFFGYAARRTPLSLLGILQFIVPSLTLLIGVLVYREPMGIDRIGAFVLIWSGVVLFVWRKRKPVSPAV